TTADPLAEKYYYNSVYTYCYNNPILYIDPTGKFGESVWDFFSLGLGIKSLQENIKSGNVGAAVFDGIGVLLDAGAAALPFIPGGVSAGIKAARVADKAANAVETVAKTDKTVDAINTTRIPEKIKGGFKIEISPENKIDRNLLNPPSKPGNAPTFKKDNKAVEIHHEGQNPNGPFKEMSQHDHRGKGNYSKNHPKMVENSKINRVEFNKAKKAYWKNEYGQ
ncbi:HNH/ENDO VII family nuclease, partial [Bacteroides heparinolyticus]|uniref:HNH/ENDO VII family nuclease n=1 Tax=Prevotella heparinolytica TaxID=28113 RepID=UPI0023EF5800